MMQPPYSDKEILDAIQARSEQWDEVMNFFYALHWPMARSIVVGKGGSEMDARDVYHDAICAIRGAVLRGRFERDRAIKPYLRTIIHNLWNTVLKHQYKHTDSGQLPEEDPTPNALDAMMLREHGTTLERIFAKIGKKCAELLRLRFVYDLKLAEIATEMGMASEDAAKMKHHRCKKELTRLLEDEPELLNSLRS